MAWVGEEVRSENEFAPKPGTLAQRRSCGEVPHGTNLEQRGTALAPIPAVKRYRHWNL
jgi:hypothetical protein